jgi:aminoglycoside phosphotransferase (APT) family kinase protein
MKEIPEAPTKIRQYRRLARNIVRKHFGQDASRIVYKSSGLTNYVFAVNHVEGQFVVRISPETEKLDTFRKELWATKEARAHGVPAPEILFVSTDEKTEPYMISRRVTGSEASNHPRRRSVIHQMGEYASVINSIRTKGFGGRFNWANNNSTDTKSWSDYLENEWKIQDRLAVFEKNHILPDGSLRHLREILDQAKTIDSPSSLSHGDLRLKNVIVDDDGEITAIIDWEESISTLARQWELSIALHDLSVDEKQSFIEGYGIDPKEVMQMAPLVKAFNVMNYAPAIDRAISEKDYKRLSQFKLRLSGSLDLYCV